MSHPEEIGGPGLHRSEVGDLLMPALGAPQDVPTQGRRAAGDQVVQRAALLRWQFGAILVQELVETTPNDLGHGEPRWGHDQGQRVLIGNLGNL